MAGGPVFCATLYIITYPLFQATKPIEKEKRQTEKTEHMYSIHWQNDLLNGVLPMAIQNKKKLFNKLQTTCSYYMHIYKNNLNTVATADTQSELSCEIYSNLSRNLLTSDSQLLKDFSSSCRL